MVRDSCIQCALKHIGQARALMLETCKGYPEHVWFAMGHLAEAEDETVHRHAELANVIRNERLRIQQNHEHKTSWEDLVNVIVKYEEELSDEQLKELYGESASQIKT
jgi:hypothetical protein